MVTGLGNKKLFTFSQQAEMTSQFPSMESASYIGHVHSYNRPFRDDNETSLKTCISLPSRKLVLIMFGTNLVHIFCRNKSNVCLCFKVFHHVYYS